MGKRVFIGACYKQFFGLNTDLRFGRVFSSKTHKNEKKKAQNTDFSEEDKFFEKKKCVAANAREISTARYLNRTDNLRFRRLFFGKKF